MNSIAKNALQKIKQEKVQPRPKWHFLMKRGVIWSIFGVAVVLGAIAWGIIFWQMENSDWDVYTHLAKAPVSLLLLTIPYLWLILMIGFTLLAIYYFRQTKSGYKHAAVWIIIGSVLLSMAAGGVLAASGVAEELEVVLERQVPLYEEMRDRQRGVWLRPEEGSLMGEIIELDFPRDLLLLDPQDHEWQVDISQVGENMPPLPPFLEELGADEPPLFVGMHIKVIGEQIVPGEFVAEMLRPVQGRKMRDSMENYLEEKGRGGPPPFLENQSGGGRGPMTGKCAPGEDCELDQFFREKMKENGKGGRTNE